MIPSVYCGAFLKEFGEALVRDLVIPAPPFIIHRPSGNEKEGIRRILSQEVRLVEKDIFTALVWEREAATTGATGRHLRDLPDSQLYVEEDRPELHGLYNLRNATIAVTTEIVTNSALVLEMIESYLHVEYTGKSKVVAAEVLFYDPLNRSVLGYSQERQAIPEGMDLKPDIKTTFVANLDVLGAIRREDPYLSINPRWEIQCMLGSPKLVAAYAIENIFFSIQTPTDLFLSKVITNQSELDG